MAENLNLVRQAIQTIKNEVEDGANTAARVGSAMSSILEYGVENYVANGTDVVNLGKFGSWSVFKAKLDGLLTAGRYVGVYNAGGSYVHNFVLLVGQAGSGVYTQALYGDFSAENMNGGVMGATGGAKVIGRVYSGGSWSAWESDAENNAGTIEKISIDLGTFTSVEELMTVLDELPGNSIGLAKSQRYHGVLKLNGGMHSSPFTVYQGFYNGGMYVFQDLDTNYMLVTLTGGSAGMQQRTNYYRRGNLSVGTGYKWDAWATETSDIETKIESLKEELESLAGDVDSNSGDISGLEDKIAALNVTSGGIYDLFNATYTPMKAEMDKIGTNGLKMYIIADSDGNFPSLKGEKSFTVSGLSKLALFGKSSSFGVSVGDVLVMTKRICRIIPLNDAKAANGDFPGADGLETVWDKTQVNKIPSIETKANAALPIADRLPSRWTSNMNDALDTGIYVWCTLGRPANSTGAYTCIVNRTSTNDGNYDTIEQTAYGREAELGRIFKRIIFYKIDGTDTQYGEWEEITAESRLQEITETIDSLSGDIDAASADISTLETKIAETNTTIETKIAETNASVEELSKTVDENYAELDDRVFNNTNKIEETVVGVAKNSAAIDANSAAIDALKNSLSLYMHSEIDLSYKDIYGNDIKMSTANCYVINKVGYYCFPLFYGSSWYKGMSRKNSYTNIGGNNTCDFVNYKDEVITYYKITGAKDAIISIADCTCVQDVQIISGYRGNIDYCCFTVKFMPEDGVGGNAVISIRDENGLVMWSWHIWLCPFDLTPITIVNDSGIEYNILPLNLGYIDYNNSLLYQWGRPTPFLGGSGTSTNTIRRNKGAIAYNVVREAATIGASISNPNTFFSNSEGLWREGACYNLWDASLDVEGRSDNSPVKTIYDPCPTGFRVPNGRLFTGCNSGTVIAKNNYGAIVEGNNYTKGYGWKFKRNADDTAGFKLPSGGYIDTEGALVQNGTYGKYWTNAVYDLNNRYHLSFNKTEITDVSPDGLTAFAFNIRPVAY